jgi:RNA polymerase sigma-70 factor (ECF subfamily)
MSSETSPAIAGDDGLAAAAASLRPELHRYCARLTGSVLDAEDVVQDTLARALAAINQMTHPPDLRPWLFRIAHNRAIDLLRARAVRAAEPISAAAEVTDPDAESADAALMRQEAVGAALSCFVELPIPQRSVVILKDVLDEPLQDIAALLGLTVDAVKAHLARGRARLRSINAATPAAPELRPASAAVARYAALFNQRDWDGLRALLADDVKLRQSFHPLRSGAADVGKFFGIYATLEPVLLAPAWLEGREVLAVFTSNDDARPAYVMRLEWRGDRITFIRDYRYVRYVMEAAELSFAGPPAPAPPPPPSA